MRPGDFLVPFQLKGTDQQMHRSDELQEKDASVIIFTCNHCPYVRAYVTRLREIIKRYQNLHVGFFLINAMMPRHYPEDSFEHMIPMAEHLGIGGNYLHDETQEIAKAYGAERTPEVFVFAKNKSLVYHGAIDDNWEKPDEVSIHYLKAALDAVLEMQK
jgi:peroxiredoxin